ncbi:MAG: NAD-dependent epimerase/dehydratase family protein [Phycisphaeraceae bacterium]
MIRARTDKPSHDGAAHNGRAAHVRRPPEPADHALTYLDNHDPRPVLITGGAGFIGTNLALRLLRGGHRVILFDNLSRPGIRRNAEHLRAAFPAGVELVVGDVRDASLLHALVTRAQAVFHLAAQVAVTTSLKDPAHDFEINLRGTFNLLEAQRTCANPPPLLFTSTNKVYGELRNVPLQMRDDRYVPIDPQVRARGVTERELDFHSPYGCSKGGADQYVLDYARTYDLPNVVFRMSCIYGRHQHGTEDQGWVAHFLIRALRGEPITLYGDGRQVRDVLFVDDLIDAMVLAIQRQDVTATRAFNIGGGPGNAVSLLEMLRLIDAFDDTRVKCQMQPWRRGDQRYFVADTSAFRRATGWRPRIATRDGLAMLHDWLVDEVPRQAITADEP